ncbi:MAG: CoA pyrophosphatase [Bdellovibrio sp.]|nr:CoA pyrophosphatase [Bdellovibrio sp.]
MSLKTLLPTLFFTPQSTDLQNKLERYACVAIILKGTDLDNLEVGFIQRALNPNDRWSGQIAFPGGKREETDPSDLHVALRETKEEVGAELQPEELLGRLDDIQARKAGQLLDFYIRPFVFYTQRDFLITLDPAEVADFFWVPIKNIQDPKRQTVFKAPRDAGFLQLPAIHLDRDPPLWGLTYLMMLNLLERVRGVVK